MIRFGIGRRIRDAVDKTLGLPSAQHKTPSALRRTGLSILRAALFYAAFSFLYLCWNLPLGFLGYRIERSYGFATYGLGLWTMDRVRGYLIGLLTVPAVWLGYLLLERSPRKWWLWLWLASIPWTVAMTVASPLLVLRAYNRFEPLPPSPLRERLLILAQKAGIGDAKVYRVDSSKRTTKVNAYVAGIGPTKRIVIWDTTLRAMPEDQIVAIVGHEIGHFVLRHVWWNVVIGIPGMLLFLWLLSRVLPLAIEKIGTKAGARNLHDIAGLPLAMLILNVFLFIQTPVESAISRYEEREADKFGLELTHLNEPTAQAFISFVESNYADPDPPKFIVFWFYSHPPLRERVEFALEYHPWQGH